MLDHLLPARRTALAAILGVYWLSNSAARARIGVSAIEIAAPPSSAVRVKEIL
jgi:hypothetical protein